MKVLWIFRNTNPIQFDSEFVRIFEKVIGKNNVSFYAKKGLPSHDAFGLPFYPTAFKTFDNIPFKEAAKEEKPDIIMVDMDYVDTSGVDIPRVTFMSDVHSEWQNRKLRVQSGQVDMILVRNYGGGIGYRVKSELCPVGYSPWSVSTHMFHDLYLERKYNIHFSGVFGPIYPLRIYMRYHIPIEGKYIADNKAFHYAQYLTTLNTSKILAFDTGLFKYSVMKFFEGMACNTLVASNLPYDCKALGFKPNVNMVRIGFRNYAERFAYYLQNERERKQIARNGMELVLKYHTKEARSKQLIAQFEELINAKNEERMFASRNVKGDAGEMLRILEEDDSTFDRNNVLHQCITGEMPTDELKNSSVLQRWYANANAFWRKIRAGIVPVEEWVKYIGEDF